AAGVLAGGGVYVWKSLRHGHLVWCFVPHGRAEMDQLIVWLNAGIKENGRIVFFYEAAPMSLAQLFRYDAKTEAKPLARMLHTVDDLNHPQVRALIEQWYRLDLADRLLYFPFVRSGRIAIPEVAQGDVDHPEYGRYLQGGIALDRYLSTHMDHIEIVHEMPTPESTEVGLRSDFAADRAVWLILDAPQFDESAYLDAMARHYLLYTRLAELRNHGIAVQIRKVMNDNPDALVFVYMGPYHEPLSGMITQADYRASDFTSERRKTADMDMPDRTALKQVHQRILSGQTISDDLRRDILSHEIHSALYKALNRKGMRSAVAAYRMINDVIARCSLADTREIIRVVRARIRVDHPITTIINELHQRGKLTPEVLSILLDDRAMLAGALFHKGHKTPDTRHMKHERIWCLVSGVSEKDSAMLSMGYDTMQVDIEMALDSTGDFRIGPLPDGKGSFLAFDEIVEKELPAAMRTIEAIRGIRLWMDAHGAQDRPLVIWQNVSVGTFYPCFTQKLKTLLGITEISVRQIEKVLQENEFNRRSDSVCRMILIRASKSSTDGKISSFTEKQILEFVKKVRAPVLMIDHSSGRISQAQMYLENSADQLACPVLRLTEKNPHYLDKDLLQSDTVFFIFNANPNPLVQGSRSLFDDPRESWKSDVIPGSRLKIWEALQSYFGRAITDIIAAERAPLTSNKIVIWDFDDTLWSFRPGTQLPYYFRKNIGRTWYRLARRGARHVIATQQSLRHVEDIMHLAGISLPVAQIFERMEIYHGNGIHGKTYKPIVERMRITNPAAEMVVIGNSVFDIPADVPGLVFILVNNIDLPAQYFEKIIRLFDGIGKGDLSRGFDNILYDSKTINGKYSDESVSFSLERVERVSNEYVRVVSDVRALNGEDPAMLAQMSRREFLRKVMGTGAALASGTMLTARGQTRRPVPQPAPEPVPVPEPEPVVLTDETHYVYRSTEKGIFGARGSRFMRSDSVRVAQTSDQHVPARQWITLRASDPSPPSDRWWAVTLDPESVPFEDFLTTPEKTGLRFAVKGAWKNADGKEFKENEYVSLAEAIIVLEDAAGQQIVMILSEFIPLRSRPQMVVITLQE
ncbi:MAG TPA: HAD family hydrolase, partial [Candidatus Bathyarchaeia archaeon]|nr:HAD family hydrolase [Candidatus Bathyarchaeia archaeon]